MLPIATRASGVRALAASLLLAAGLVAVAGCAVTSGAVTSGSVPTRSAASPASTSGSGGLAPTAVAAAPALVPDGTAQDNLALFHEVTERVWHGDDRVHGRAYIDALAKAGFDKKAMQVTGDRSTVGNPAESLQFSVRWNDGQCLVGQVGPETGTPITVVLPGLADGACLLGTTRPIDW